LGEKRKEEVQGNHFRYFLTYLSYDALGRRGLTLLIKSALRTMRTYTKDMCIDYLSKYLKMGESTTIEFMDMFTANVIAMFVEEHLDFVWT